MVNIRAPGRMLRRPRRRPPIVPPVMPPAHVLANFLSCGVGEGEFQCQRRVDRVADIAKWLVRKVGIRQSGY